MSAPPPPSRAPKSRRIALALLRYFPHGGLQRIARDSAAALAGRGHRVTLFVHDWQGPLPGPSAVGTGTFDVEILSVRGLSNHGKAARFGRALQIRLRHDPVDVVLGFDRLPGLDLYFCADPCYSARIRRDRSTFHRHTPRARAFLGLERRVFGKESSTRILLMNGAEQSIIQAEYGTPSARFTVLPPGYSAAPSRDAPARNRPMNLLLLALGSDFHRKGFDRVIRALPALRTALPDRRALLAIAGAGNPGPLRRLAEELGVSSNIRWLGARDDVPALLQAADVLVHPCRSEPAGMVILEALSAGTPVVVSACAGYARHVEASGAGAILAEPFELDDLVEALRDVANTPLPRLRELALAHMAGLEPNAMIDAIVREVERP